MRLTKTLRVIVRAATLGATAVLVSGAAHAATAGGGMPWEGPLTAVLDSITGPVARIVAILIIVATGLTLAFGDVGQGFKKLLQILFGLAIAFAASRSSASRCRRSSRSDRVRDGLVDSTHGACAAFPARRGPTCRWRRSGVCRPSHARHRGSDCRDRRCRQTPRRDCRTMLQGPLCHH